MGISQIVTLSASIDTMDQMATCCGFIVYHTEILPRRGQNVFHFLSCLIFGTLRTHFNNVGRINILKYSGYSAVHRLYGGLCLHIC